MPKDLLRKTPLFRAMTDEQLDKILAQCKKRHFESGDVVLSEGEEGDEMYIVHQGQVEISKAIHVQIPGRGEVSFEKQLVVLGEGTYFGEVALLAKDNRSATVTARTPLDAWVLDSESMQQLMDQDLDLGYKLLSVMSRELCKRLAAANEDIRKLMTAFTIAINR